MATRTGKEQGSKNGTFSKDAKVADIHTASISLAAGKDFSMGYDPTMQHHINRKGEGRSKVRG